MKYIILVLIIIIVISIDFKIIERFIQNNNIDLLKYVKHQDNIWIYVPDEISSRFWNDFHGRRHLQKNNLIHNKCIESISKHTNVKINILTDAYIRHHFKDLPFTWESINKHKLYYLKFYILYHYGGFWLTPYTLCFKNVDLILKCINKFDLVLIRTIEKQVSNKYFGGKRYSHQIKIILEDIQQNINNKHINDFDNHLLKIFEKNINEKYEILPNNIIANYNFNKQLTVNEIISFHEKDINETSIFLDLDILNKRIFHKWIFRLNNEQLLDSNMWLSKLLKH